MHREDQVQAVVINPSASCHYWASRLGCQVKAQEQVRSRVPRFTQRSVWTGECSARHKSYCAINLCLFYWPSVTACWLNTAGNTRALQGQEVIVLFSFCSMGDNCWGSQVCTGQITAYLEAKRECFLHPKHAMSYQQNIKILWFISIVILTNRK